MDKDKTQTQKQNMSRHRARICLWDETTDGRCSLEWSDLLQGIAGGHLESRLGGGGCQISPLPFLLTHTYSDIICTFSTRLHRLSLYELGNFLKPIMIPALIARGRKHFSEIAYNSVFQKMHTSQQDTAIVTLTGRTWLGGGSCNFHLLV